MCFKDGSYLNRQILDSAINTKGDEFNAYVDPAEKMLIFSSYKGRPDEQGGGDLYISNKDANGKWQKAVNMGILVNSAALDYCPFVTADKKRMFFSSNRNNLSKSTPENCNDLVQMLSSTGNSSDDIYWIDFSSFAK